MNNPREQYLKDKALFDERFREWQENGRKGPPPPHPIPPHMPGDAASSMVGLTNE